MVARQKDLLLRMSVRATLYYAILAAAVAMATSFIPGFAELLPLGGVGEIADYGSYSVYDHPIDLATLVLPAVVAGRSSWSKLFSTAPSLMRSIRSADQYSGILQDMAPASLRR